MKEGKKIKIKRENGKIENMIRNKEIESKRDWQRGSDGKKGKRTERKDETRNRKS